MIKDGKNLGMRPGSTVFSQDIFDAICDRIAGGESLKDITDEPGMPTRRSVCRWLAQSEAADGLLVLQYQKARESQADQEFEEIKQIADSATPENVQVARLQIDTRKWRAAKLRPKVYGDKVAVGGAEDLPPIKTEDSGAVLLAAFLSDIAERSGTSGDSA